LPSRAAQPVRDPSTDHLHRRGGSILSGWIPENRFAVSGKTTRVSGKTRRGFRDSRERFPDNRERFRDNREG